MNELFKEKDVVAIIAIVAIVLLLDYLIKGC